MAEGCLTALVLLKIVTPLTFNSFDSLKFFKMIKLSNKDDHQMQFNHLFESLKNKSKKNNSLDKSGKLYLKGGETVVKRRKSIDYKALNENVRHKINLKQK